MAAFLIITLFSLCAYALALDLRRIEREKKDAEDKLFDSELERLLGN